MRSGLVMACCGLMASCGGGCGGGATDPSQPPLTSPPLVLTAREVTIGAANIAYRDPEVWIEGRKVAWQDGEDQIWLADVDPKSGEWIPANGQGRVIGRAANIEADHSTGRPGSWNGPEWGFSQQGGCTSGL